MKTKETKVFVTKSLYIANDGREFETEQECLEHEAELKKIEDNFFSLKTQNFAPDDCGFNYDDATADGYAINIDSEETARAVIEYAEFRADETYYKGEVEVGKCVALIFSSGDYWATFYNLDEHIKRLESEFAKIKSALS